MSKYPDHCQGCDRKTGDSCMYFRNCEKWLKRYRHRQKQINLFAIAHLRNKQNTLQKSPCESCSANGNCDTICKARVAWWDQRIKVIRKALISSEEKESTFV